VVVHEDHGDAVGERGRDARALLLRLGEAAVGEACDAAVEVHGVLARTRVEPALGHRERSGVRHVRVEDAGGVRPRAMGTEVDRERRGVQLALACQALAAEADREQVARSHLGPVRAVGIEQEAVVAAWDDEAEVVVDALVEAVEGRGAQRGRELDACDAEPRVRGDIQRCRHHAILRAERGVSFRPRAGARDACSRGAPLVSRAPRRAGRR